VRRADNLTTFMCRLSRNLGASTSWDPKGLSRPVMGLLYLALHKKLIYCYHVSLYYLHLPENSDLMAETCRRVQAYVWVLISIMCVCWYQWMMVTSILVYKIVLRQMYTLYYLLFNTVYIKNSRICFELCYSSSSGTELFITPAIDVWYSVKYIT
jgi:hypothetical protein